jgi:hypothetical protein
MLLPTVVRDLIAANDSSPPGMFSDGMMPAVPRPSLRPMIMKRHPSAVPAGKQEERRLTCEYAATA